MHLEHANTLVDQWTNDIPEFPEVTEKLRSALSTILINYLDDHQGYAAEKLIKSFSEPIYYRHAILMEQEGLTHPTAWRPNLADIRERYRRVSARLMSEISRQQYHFATFLEAVK